MKEPDAPEEQGCIKLAETAPAEQGGQSWPPLSDNRRLLTFQSGPNAGDLSSAP
jgi:hypothetical protein